MAASFLFPAQSAPVEEPKTVISMALTDYRAYLKSNAPLDRLYISGEECFFLVGGRELAGIKNRGVHVREQLLPHPGLSRPLDTVNGLYHNYLEIESLFLELAAQYPDLASVSSIGRSVEGREIYVMKISDNVTNTEAEPNIGLPSCQGMDFGGNAGTFCSFPAGELPRRCPGKKSSRWRANIYPAAAQSRRPGVFYPDLPHVAQKPRCQRRF